jgi:hypothetical protein
MVMPWIKIGGKALLREGLGTGLQIAQDALAVRNVRESFKDADQRLLQWAVEHLEGGNQLGSDIRKRRRAPPPGEPLRKRIKQTTKARRSHSARKKNQKKKHFDIFG